jgi:hypothetical protein
VSINRYLAYQYLTLNTKADLDTYDIPFNRVCSNEDTDAIWTYDFNKKHLPFPNNYPTFHFSVSFTLTIPVQAHLPLYLAAFITTLIKETEEWIEPPNEEIMFDNITYRCGDEIVVGVMQLKTYGNLPALYMRALAASEVCFHNALGPIHYHSKSTTLASETCRDYWLSLTHEVTRYVHSSPTSDGSDQSWLDCRELTDPTMTEHDGIDSY